MAIRRLYQLLAAAETQAGVAASNLLTAGNANFLVIDPQLTYNPEQYERANINRASLSPLQPLAGVTTGQLSFQLELAGTGSATVPPWGLLLRASGMEQWATSALQIGAITGGPFYHGETVTGGTSAATGRVLHDTYSGATEVLYFVTSGVFQSGETLTGGTSGATATTSSAPWSYGTTWYPTSTEILTMLNASITGTNDAGNVMRGGTSGAIGILLDAVTGAETFTMRVLDGTFTSGETLNNLSQSGTIVNVTGFSQTSLPSLSMAVVEDGVAKQLKGCRGTWSLAGNIGEAMLFSFQFQGLINGNPTDAGTVTGVTYTTVVPPAMLGVTLDVGDDTDTTMALEFEPRFQALTLDHANSLAIPRDAGESTGVYGSAHVTSRASTGSVTVDVAPENSYDFLAKLINGGSSRIRLDIGTTVGNRFKISTPSAVFNSETIGDQDGIATRDLAFRIASRRPGGVDRDDSEIIITYVADVTP